MSTNVTPKAAVATRGCPNARRWQDIRQAARLSRSEGVTLIIHKNGDVTVTSKGDKENQSQPSNTTKSTSHDGRERKPTATAGDASAQPSKKQQRDAKRAEANRARDAQHAQESRVAERWQPLAHLLRRRKRAKLRNDVWTEYMRESIALRDKLRDFVARACRSIALWRSSARAIRDAWDARIEKRGWALIKMRNLFSLYRYLCDEEAATLELKASTDSDESATASRTTTPRVHVRTSPVDRRFTAKSGGKTRGRYQRR